MLKHYKRSLGPVGTNCYVVANEKKECLIFDPSAEGHKIMALIKEKGLKPQAILLTHAHFDHIGALDEVRDRFDVPVYVHKKEKDWLGDPSKNASASFPLGPVTAKEATNLWDVEGEKTIGNFSFSVLETPGHTPGSVSYVFKEDDFVISGDVLFAGSIGRTDLPGGNHEELLESIHKKMLTLGETMLVLSGHGEETTIEREMDSNPFLNGFM
ncbi:MBL fold metallo-hydrolase [Priestia filamentosa]|nr:MULTISPECIES: MBL fold metallo-hydrolase [Priestia]MCY8232951.1 MBL fold metallo-hydrolase [Priestia endophytica]MED3725319.1 MBL fold metallo-hydrolase [Priestia filamentosa]RPK15733.1 hypothetical protein FH5_01168 [Priestia endophytica]UOE61430.1 MBL fold metallo-hydrolase [Priestia filamentosa]